MTDFTLFDDDLFDDFLDLLPSPSPNLAEDATTSAFVSEHPEERRTVPHYFLAINKEHFGLGLKSLDLLILSQIEEFQRNRLPCFMSNKQFSDMFGESESSIKRSIEKLEQQNIVKRHTNFIQGNGRSNRQRTLFIAPRNQWQVQSNTTFPLPCSAMESSTLPMEDSDFPMKRSNPTNGKSKSTPSKVHNEPIINNIKNNLTDNIKENIAIIEFIIKKFKAKNSYKQIIAAVAEEFGLFLSFEQIRDVIDAREECQRQIDYNKCLREEELEKQRRYEYQYLKLPEALEYMENHGIHTTEEEVKAAFIKIQESTASVKWSIFDLCDEHYEAFARQHTTFSDYVDAIHDRQNKLFGEQWGW